MTSKKELIEMMESDDFNIQIEAVSDKNSDEDIWKLGINSKYASVVYSTLSRKNNLSEDFLRKAFDKYKRLLKSTKPVIMWAIGLHQNTPDDVLLKILSSGSAYTTRSVPLNKNASEKVLIECAENKHVEVRKLAMQNKNATMKILKIGDKDTDEFVRRAAHSNKNWKGTETKSMIKSSIRRLSYFE